MKRILSSLGAVIILLTAAMASAQAKDKPSQAFLKKAIGQLEVDIRGEVVQVNPAGDPGPSKLQPVWVGVGREPSAQDVPDHARPAGPGIAPRPHRGLVNLLIVGGQVEQFPAADVIDEGLFH